MTRIPRAAARSRSPGKAAAFSLAVPADFSLRETVLSHGWHELAPFRWHTQESRLERIELLPDASLHHLRIRQPGGKGKRLRVQVRGAGDTAGAWPQLVPRLRRMLNLDLDLSHFMALCRREPRLRYVPRVGAGRFLTAGNVYEDVLKAICGTNIAWKQAVLAVNRFAALGRPLAGAEGRAFPTAEEILRCGPDRLREISRLGYRVPYLLDWARRVASGDPAWAAAESGSLDGEELRRFFLSVQGVGKTTARYLLMMRGIADEIPIDSSVFLYLRKQRFNGRTPSERQIHRLYERHGEWKGYAYWFEFLPWARQHWSLDGK